MQSISGLKSFGGKFQCLLIKQDYFAVSDGLEIGGEGNRKTREEPRSFLSFLINIARRGWFGTIELMAKLEGCQS